MVRKNYLTVHEVAEELDVSVQSIYRLVKKGTLPAKRLPGLKKIRIHMEDFEKYKVGVPIYEGDFGEYEVGAPIFFTNETKIKAETKDESSD